MSVSTSKVSASSPVGSAPASEWAEGRHGTARLFLNINEYAYSLVPTVVPGVKGCRAWRVRVVNGHPSRNGNVYITGYSPGVGHRCSCPDSVRNGAVCKHLGALVAAGLLPKGSRSRSARKGVAQ